MIKFNFSVALAAMASPLWIEKLTFLSTMAALLLPIAGLGLAIVQIILLIRRWKQP